MFLRRLFLIGLLGWASSVQADPHCNTGSGFVANQPAETAIGDGSIGVPPSAPEPAGDMSVASSVDGPLPTDARRLDAQTLRVDLARDVEALNGFTGRYTTGVPVLGLRMENFPGYDRKLYCNAVQPILYKPRIETLSDGRVQASVENGRFQIAFRSGDFPDGWVQDKDPSGRFFWIFPQRFGGAGMPTITRAYDLALTKAPVHSAQRRWIAEAYINLAMRLYRLRKLNRGYPTGETPRVEVLHAALLARIGRSCDAGDSDLACLASRLIEMNEAPPPGPYLSADAFRVGDALLENSGC